MNLRILTLLLDHRAILVVLVIIIDLFVGKEVELPRFDCAGRIVLFRKQRVS